MTEEVRTTLACLETEEGEENSEAEGADDADDSSKEGHQDDGEVDKDSSDDDGDGLQEGPDELAVNESATGIDTYEGRELTRRQRGAGRQRGRCRREGA